MTFNQYWNYLIISVPHNVYIWSLVIFCVGTVMLIGFLGLNRGGKYCLGLLLAEYVSLIYCSMVIFRSASKVREFCFIPFWSYSEPRLFVENVMNVVIFVPVGLLLGGVFRSMTWKRVLMIGLCLSVGIEVLQFVMRRGFSEVDDVIHNTLGCVIGYGVFSLVRFGYERVCKRSVAFSRLASSNER